MSYTVSNTALDIGNTRIYNNSNAPHYNFTYNLPADTTVESVTLSVPERQDTNGDATNTIWVGGWDTSAGGTQVGTLSWINTNGNALSSPSYRTASLSTTTSLWSSGSVALYIRGSGVIYGGYYLTLTITYRYNTGRLTLSTSTVVAGGTVGINIGEFVSANTYSAVCTYGSYSSSPTSITHSSGDTITISKDIMSQMTTTSCTASVVLYTYGSSGESLGTSVANVNVTVSDDAKPTMTCSCMPYMTGSFATSYYTQGVSGVTAKITSPNSKYGASIASTSISVAGRQDSGYYLSGNTDSPAITLNSSPITDSGTVRVYFRITDTRGAYTEQYIDLTVYAYSSPSVSTDVYSVWRCDEDGTDNLTGTNIEYKVKWSYTQITYPDGTKNSATAKFSVKKSSEATTAMTECSNSISTADTELTGILKKSDGSYYSAELTNSYVVRLTVTDKFNSSTFDIVAPSAEFVRNVARIADDDGNYHTAVAYGKAATIGSCFEINEDWDFRVHGKEIEELCLTNASASSTYLTQSDALNTYLSKTDASSQYALASNVVSKDYASINYGIEISSTSQPYIDFHYNGNTTDYDARLICNGTERLISYNTFFNWVKPIVNGMVSPGGTYAYTASANKFFIIMTFNWTVGNSGGLYLCMTTSGLAVTKIAASDNTTVTMTANGSYFNINIKATSSTSTYYYIYQLFY